MAFTAEGGVEPKGERYDRSYLVKSDDKLYKRTEFNDFIYSSNNLDVGSIGLNKYGTAVISDVYEIFRVKPDNSPTFMSELIQRPHNIAEILKYRQGCLYGQYRIYAEDFLNVSVLVPTKLEQEKVSQLFDALDHRIEHQASLIKALKKYKRGLSDTLFAHIVQRSDCQIMNLGEVFELLQNNTFSREELTDIPSSVQNIHYGDVLIKYRAIVNIVADKPPYIKPDIDLQKFSPASYLCDGDIVFADTAEDYSVGKAIEITGTNGQAVLSGLHTIPCRPLVKFHPMYLGFYFNSSLFRTQIYPLVQGTKVSSISKGELVKASVHVPTLEEQKKIALLLYSMEYRIALEEKKSSDLITARAALLQQLFI
ncbi:restriction endonuclease subunit S [Ruminococcus sp.]|uniref:restriction endonuclease subunit S n=1 Tax=Ruminococcus sp. TaxID=41978 RepID=UPI003AF1C5A2